MEDSPTLATYLPAGRLQAEGHTHSVSFYFLYEMELASPSEGFLRECVQMKGPDGTSSHHPSQLSSEPPPSSLG